MYPKQFERDHVPTKLRTLADDTERRIGHVIATENQTKSTSYGVIPTTAFLDKKGAAPRGKAAAYGQRGWVGVYGPAKPAPCSTQIVKIA
ncbi:MAG: hypothetical protein ACI91Z_001760 [Yoonia sp.]